MKTISCITIGDKSYIKADLAMPCYDYTYYSYTLSLAVPALALWAFIVPLLLLNQLFKNRKKLKSIKMKIRYGYLYSEYRIFYWEFVKIYEKILLIIIVEYFDSEINIKGLLSLFILGVYYILNSRFQPYIKKFQNQLDRSTALICFATIFTGLYIHDQNSEELMSLGYVIIGLINIIYNLQMIRLIASAFLFKMQKQIDIIKGKLFKITPIFKICFFEFKKPLKTADRWIEVRRLTARYLREKERRKMNNEINDDDESFNLSLNGYDPMLVGIQRKLKLKKSPSRQERKKLLTTEADQCLLESPSITGTQNNQESNSFFNSTGRRLTQKNLRQPEEIKKEKELNEFLADALAKVRLSDYKD